MCSTVKAFNLILNVYNNDVVRLLLIGISSELDLKKHQSYWTMFTIIN